MSIADEFKLREIPKTKGWYAPNRRRLVKTKSGKVQVRKVAVKIGLKTNNVPKERADRLNKRKEKYEAYTKKSEEIKLWTLRELLIFLEGRDPKKSATVSNIVNDIVRGKYNDEG